MIRNSIQSFRRYLLDRMVLRPSRDAIEFSHQRRVMLRDGTRPLECFVQSNWDKADQTPNLLVLKFPGTAGRGERSTTFPMSFLPDAKVDMWTWNPPGYGRSPGRASLPGIANAAVEFWTQVTRQYDFPSMRIWLCGNSLGSVTAFHVAATMNLDPNRCGIIVRDPPPLKTVVKRVALRYPLGRWVDSVIESLDPSMDAISSARRVSLPAVFLTSELDSLVLAQDQEGLRNIYDGPCRSVLLEGLEHGGLMSETHAPLIEDSLRWLWNSTAVRENDKSSAH